MRENGDIPIFWLALRSAAFASPVIGLIVGAAVYFSSAVTAAYAIIAGLCAVIGSFLIVYAVVYKLFFRRLNHLKDIIRQIATKQFEEQLKTQKENDELDTLTDQLVDANQTIEREIQRLNRIENYRKEFIGDLAHELKTPIFAIQGFIETLLNGAMDDSKVNRKFLEKALRNAGRLTYLTED